MTCPFCNDTGFDLYGLKMHIQLNWCQAYDSMNDDHKSGAWVWNSEFDRWEEVQP